MGAMNGYFLTHCERASLCQLRAAATAAGGIRGVPVRLVICVSHRLTVLSSMWPDGTYVFLFKQVVTNRDTQETLLCMACVFEVSNSEHGAQHHIYRLVKD